MIKFQILLILFLYQVSGYGQVDSNSFVIGKESIVYSQILAEDRPIIIYTPRDYEEKDVKYPVIYLLDGAWNFHHTTATVDFLSRNEQIPEMIVVAINNTRDRTHDLTPKTLAPEMSYPTSGGADSFFLFIEKELIPFIDNNFRTEDYKLLIGHSFGGLFAIHTLINHPEIFNAYLAISPSLWWDNQHLVIRQALSFFENHENLTGHLYMTMGDEGNTMVGGAWKLAAILEEKGPEFLKWTFDRMPEETHNTIPILSTYKGLQFIFKEWNINNLQEILEQGGIGVLDQYEKDVIQLYGLKPKIKESFLRGIGESYVFADRVEEAAKIYRKNALLYPNSELSQSEAGSILVKIGKTAEAVPFLKKALDLNPENKQAIVSLRKAGEDISEYIPEIKYTKDELRAFTGKYKGPNKLNLLIELKGKKIWVSGKGTPKTQLLPLGKNQFFVDLLGAEIEFTKENGKVTGFIATLQDQQFLVKKVE